MFVGPISSVDLSHSPEDAFLLFSEITANEKKNNSQITYIAYWAYKPIDFEQPLPREQTLDSPTV